MTAQKLRYIIEVVNKGSINEASKTLFISQPSLSNAIKEVESILGFNIFIRTNKGVVLSQEGIEFLGYARQVIEQEDLLRQRYLKLKSNKQVFSVSTQHYAFVVKAFVNFVDKYGQDEYEFIFRDTRTYEILEDVKSLKSEVGVIYMNDFNKKVIQNFIDQHDLKFNQLFTAKPHVFISSKNPLAKKSTIDLEDLENYTCLSFEQGENNSFYYSEEILSTMVHKKSIKVSDRATIFNLMIGLNAYTISTGVINSDLNGDGIIAVPLNIEDFITVGWIAHKKIKLSKLANYFIEELNFCIN